MDDLLTKIGIGGGSGLVGVVLGLFGFKTKVQRLEKDMTEIKKDARYTITCIAVHKAVDEKLASMETMQKEMRDDIKELIRR